MYKNGNKDYYIQRKSRHFMSLEEDQDNPLNECQDTNDKV